MDKGRNVQAIGLRKKATIGLDLAVLMVARNQLILLSYTQTTRGIPTIDVLL